MDRGRGEKAEALAREALGLRQQVHGPEHPEVAAAMAQVATALDAGHRFDEAEQTYPRGSGP